ncbi:MAG: transglutaminase-like cysteine peptidase, partial [Oricola sp.]
TKELDRTMTGSVASSFFGTVAVPFSPIGSRADWDRVRSAASVSAMETCATPACRFRLASVRKTLKSGGSESFFEKLSVVNRLVNRSIRYAPDQATYGRLDHWAAGSETVRVGSGDCEDFAILKMSLLREMGVPAKSISLVILRDTARGLYHAVLAVSTNKGHFILDNMQDKVYRDVAVRNYLPLYSFSTDRSWIHGKPAGELVASAPSALPLGSIAPGESAGAVLDLANALNGLGLDLRPTSAF